MGKHGFPVSYDNDWIVTHWESFRNWLKLCEEYNRVHGTEISYSTFKSHCNRELGLNYHYTEEQIEWLKGNYPKLGRVKAAKAFNEKFGEKKTPQAIKAQCLKIGLKVKENRWQERAIENSGRFHPVGTIRPMSHGEPYIKTESGWMPLKHKLIGKKDGKIIVFLDGDRMNVNERNLMFTTKAVSARMTKNMFWSENPEITRTGIIWCELEQTLKENQ